MRPINLIPLEQRSGERAPLRSGSLAYILVGALVAVLAAVTALVLVGNQIAERESEIATLEAEDAEAKAKAERLAAYTQFRNLSEQRVATIASLADSRFDWERVMRELSLVLPKGDAWLTALTASASSGASVGGGSGDGSSSDLRGAALGPALELSGCASGHEAVAGFVTALKDIDGVTRVGVQSSELPDEAAGGGGSGGSEEEDECRTRQFIAQFEIVVAFDAAPVPPSAEAEAAAVPAAPEAESASTETSSEGSSEGEGG